MDNKYTYDKPIGLVARLEAEINGVLKKGYPDTHQTYRLVETITLRVIAEWIRDFERYDLNMADYQIITKSGTIERIGDVVYGTSDPSRIIVVVRHLPTARVLSIADLERAPCDHDECTDIPGMYARSCAPPTYRIVTLPVGEI